MRRASQENYCNRTGARPGMVKQLSNIKGKVAIWRKGRKSLLQKNFDKLSGKKRNCKYRKYGNVYIPLIACEK